MTADTYIDEIAVFEKEREDWVFSIYIKDTEIVIDYAFEYDFYTKNTPTNEKITLGNICKYLKGQTFYGKEWTEDYLGTQLSEWGYDWEITYKE